VEGYEGVAVVRGVPRGFRPPTAELRSNGYRFAVYFYLRSSHGGEHPLARASIFTADSHNQSRCVSRIRRASSVAPSQGGGTPVAENLRRVGYE